MNPELVVRECVRQDLPALLSHFERIFAESGKNDVPFFHPFDEKTPWTRDDGEKRIPALWATKVGEPNWRRDWGLFLGEKMVGNLDLNGSRLNSMIHRCRLGIGIESGYRSAGYGETLMLAAIAWAKKQPSLVWLDLNVFENNVKAIRLYEKLGFQHLGLTPDRFRLGGRSIGDHAMALKLRDAP